MMLYDIEIGDVSRFCGRYELRLWSIQKHMLATIEFHLLLIYHLKELFLRYKGGS